MSNSEHHMTNEQAFAHLEAVTNTLEGVLSMIENTALGLCGGPGLRSAFSGSLSSIARAMASVQEEMTVIAKDISCLDETGEIPLAPVRKDSDD